MTHSPVAHSGAVEGLLTQAARTTDMRERSRLIGEATAAHVASTGFSPSESALPAFEDCIDESPVLEDQEPADLERSAPPAGAGPEKAEAADDAAEVPETFRKDW